MYEERNWPEEIKWWERRQSLNEHLPPRVTVRERWWLCVDLPEDPDLPGDTPQLASLRFEKVSLEGCLQYSGDPGAALAHWWRLVQPNGRLAVLVPDGRQPRVDEARMAWSQKRPLWSYDIQVPSDPTAHRLNLMELVGALPECHIDLVKVCGMNEITYHMSSMVDLGTGYLYLEARRLSVDQNFANKMEDGRGKTEEAMTFDTWRSNRSRTGEPGS